MKTLNVSADRRFIRTTYRSNRFVLAEIQAPAAPIGRPRPPVNLSFVIDRSGSMGGAKIEIAKEAVRDAIGRLRDDDRFSVVVYDDRIDVVVASTRATPAARREAVDRIAGIEARGSTDLGEGWLRGCQQVAEYQAAEGVNRCLLLTDGLANVGIMDPEVLRQHAAELRLRGVSTSTFGVGEDFSESLLQAMADAGGGHFYYIANAAAIRDTMTSEVGETLEVVARDVALEVTAPEGVRVESLSGFATTERGGRSSVALGDLVSNQVVQLVLRINFPFGEAGREIGALFAMTDRGAVMGGASESPRRLAWEYADNATNDGQERDVAVDRVVAAVFAARARQEAVALNRLGDYRAARQAVSSTARRIRAYAGRDPMLRSTLAKLEEELPAYAAMMPERSRKQIHFASHNVARMRQMDGTATRRES